MQGAWHALFFYYYFHFIFIPEAPFLFSLFFFFSMQQRSFLCPLSSQAKVMMKENRQSDRISQQVLIRSNYNTKFDPFRTHGAKDTVPNVQTRPWPKFGQPGGLTTPHRQTQRRMQEPFQLAFSAYSENSLTISHCRHSSNPHSSMLDIPQKSALYTIHSHIHS